jgi:diguanylate cyclase (GGDEF)-like protein
LEEADGVASLRRGKELQTVGMITEIADALARTDLKGSPAATRRIMQMLVENFGVSVAFLRLHDQRRRTTTLYAEWPPRSVDGPVDPLGVLHFDRAGPVISQQEHQKDVAELHVDAGQLGEHGLLDAAGLRPPRSLLVVPVLSAQGATIGVIGVDSASARAWTAEERDTLTTVAALLALTHARHVAELRTRNRTGRDPLTGLPTRTALLAYLADRLAAADAVPVTALMVRFSDVVAATERMGHDAGDDFIVAAADRLRVALLGTGTVFRTAAHEFVVVPLHGNTSDARRTAVGLQKVLEDPLPLHDDVVVPRINVGIATAFPDSPDPAALLRGLRQAVTHAQTDSTSSISVLNRNIVRTAKRRNDIEADIRDAIRHGSLWLAYQPEVDLRTRRIVGMEALVRWRHPTLGELLPEAFLDVVEEMNLAGDLGRWVLRTACAALSAWKRDGLADDVILRVNVSPRQLVDPDFIDTVAGVLAEFEIGPGVLCVEFTETVVLHDLDAVRALVTRLQAIGVTVAIDDFGTGYSGFTRLKALPVDTVKIDRSFVGEVNANLHDRAIVAAVIAMADAFRIDVVAEGVETDEAAATLLELGCTYAQGYLFSRPVEATRMRRLLEDRKRRASDSVSG